MSMDSPSLLPTFRKRYFGIASNQHCTTQGNGR